jgi:hypothetical protein
MVRSTASRKQKPLSPRTESVQAQAVIEDQKPQGSQTLLKLLPLIACLCAVIWFFHDFFQFGFDLVAGDIGDNRFIIAILEHWRHFFFGQIVDFTSPIFFYPEKDMLGSSESLFLFAIPYTIIRATGADMALSFELTLIAIKVIGFCGMFLLAQRFLNTGTVLATFAASLFTVSNMYFISTGHAQLSAIAFLPWIALLGAAYWRKQAYRQTLLCRLSIMSAGSLAALVLYTSFYIGWFMILTAATLAVTLLLALALQERSLYPLRRLIRVAHQHKANLSLGVLAFAIAVVPFLITYLPTLQRTGGRSFEEAVMYMAEPVDIYNVGPLNVVWSTLLNPYYQRLASRPGNAEKTRGWPPATTVVFAVLVVVLIWRLCRNPRSLTPLLVFAAAAGITCVGLWLFTLRYGDLAPWWFAFKYVPGGAAIRVPPRFNLVLNALGIIALVIGMSHVGATKRRRRMVTAGAGCVLAFLIVEQLNVQHFHLISRSSETSMFSRVAAPPSQCKSFYVANVAYPGRPFWATQIDAMLISQQFNLPTVNGYSGWFPVEWKLFSTADADYIENAHNWALSKGIDSGFCALNLASGVWGVDGKLQRAAYTFGDTVDFRAGGNSARFKGLGWWTSEPGGSWIVGPRSDLLIDIGAPPKYDLLLDLEMHAFTPAERPHFPLSFFLNDTELVTWDINDREQVMRKHIVLDKRLIPSSLLKLTFVNHDPRSPADLGLSVDARKLGVALHTISILPKP